MKTGELIGHALFLALVAGLGALAGSSGGRRRMRRNVSMDAVQAARTDRRLAEFWRQPVTRREFEDELHRIWDAIDPKVYNRVVYPRTDRYCAFCGGSNFAGRKAEAIYCSPQCKQHMEIDRQRLRNRLSPEEYRAVLDEEMQRTRRLCPQCGTTDFTGRSSQAIYCSQQCKREAEYEARVAKKSLPPPSKLQSKKPKYLRIFSAAS